jgi:hypothetical protein
VTRHEATKAEREKTMTTAMIRPGILVSLKSTVAGGVEYQRTDLASEALDTGAHRAKWETTKVVQDPAEHERATKARAKALQGIRAICSPTTFGLLCPLSRERELDEAVRAARAIVSAHNATAVATFVSVYCLKGQIASTDEEAARAIGSEVAALIGSMSGAIDRLDAEAIRDAADKARTMSTMLNDEQAEKVSEAIKQARSAARAIVKRIEKDGEAAAIVLADIQRGAIEKARIAFLDMSDEAPAEPKDTLPAASPQRIAALDVEDDDMHHADEGEDGPSSKAPEDLRAASGV